MAAEVPSSKVPTAGEVIAAAHELRAAQPEIGRAKILAHLKDSKQWRLSEARLKRLIPSANEGRPPELPVDALAAQQQYKDDSTRCFRIYGRGQYNYGVTPNADMAILIELCHRRMAEYVRLSGPHSEGEKASLARSGTALQIWDFYCAAGRIAGVSREDLGRQMEAEYGIDPIPYLPPNPTARQKEERRRTFRQKSMDVKRNLIGSSAEARRAIPVDGREQPIWDERRNGEWTLVVVRIDKGDGLLEFGEVEWDPSCEKPGQSILRWV